MFRQIKSALFWYYLYRFRRRVALIVMLLALIFLSGSIYSDVVEYLRLRGKIELLDLILPLKWTIILGSIFLIAYLVLTMFDKSKEPKKEESPKKLSKKEIRSLAERIIEEKRSRKT